MKTAPEASTKKSYAAPKLSAYRDLFVLTTAVNPKGSKDGNPNNTKT
jgi:hypothetical protein